jgi:outer membrane lipoprotein carrier protein
MRSSFAALFATVLITVSTPAQPTVQTVPAHVDAKGIARALEEHYQHAGTLKAIFLERYRQGGELTQVETGTVYFSHGGRMRWDYSSPEKKLFLVDGANVWFYVPSDHTASRAKLRDSTDWRTPFALLTGKMNLARLCGQLAFASSDKSEEPMVDQKLLGDRILKCSPKGPPDDSSDSGFKEILLAIDPEYRLTRVIVREPGDVETDFQFGNWQENVPVPEAFFHFEPPQGVAIVDEQALTSQIH